MRKRFLTLVFSLLSSTSLLLAQVPEWVTTHPAPADAYVGVGVAKLSDANHVKKATQAALADIASQISARIDQQSFFNVVDVDGKSRELFEEKIQTQLTAWLEGQELIGSYASKDSYYVCYSLSKETYAQNAEKRRSEVAATGLSYLRNGWAAEEGMNLALAAQLYAKGLEEVEAWTFMNLTATHDDALINVPSELYAAYLNVFSGMAMTTNVTQVQAEPFKAVKSPLAACLSKNGVPIPNMPLKAEFISGGGALTSGVSTDADGTAEFYITNVTSKDAVQEVQISLSDNFMKHLPKAYRELVANQALPMAKITVALQQAGKTAYIYVGEQHDIEGLERALLTTLGNNHFSVTEDPDGADLFVDITTKLDLGPEVTGGTYNLNTNLCTLVMKIYNNATEALLLTYSVNNLKVLTPTHMSAEETLSACVREVMKRVNRELPSRLKKMNIN